MTALPVAIPINTPEALAVIVRASEDCQAKFVDTSLTEPSLKVATAFNCVVPPMATAVLEGVIVTDWTVAVATLFSAGKTLLAGLFDSLVPAVELTFFVPTGLATLPPVKFADTTWLGANPYPAG